MTGGATVALALGPAAITGTVAYFGARFQRDTSKAETGAATLRVRIEHAETERAHRQGVYHNFLILLQQHDAMMRGFASLDEQKYQEWIGSYYSLFQGLHLFGAQGVRDALTPLTDALEKFGADGAHETGRAGLPIHEGMKAAYSRPHRGALINATTQLTEAMRADVAADLVLPKLGPHLEQQKLPPGAQPPQAPTT